jgi:hypothetical protein
MRKGPLSNKDKKFIQGNLDMNIAELAGDLDRSEKAVKQYVNELAEQSPPPPEETLAMQQFGRNKKYGAVVMTENASTMSDETRSKPKQLDEIRKYRGAIHRIREE